MNSFLRARLRARLWRGRNNRRRIRGRRNNQKKKELLPGQNFKERVDLWFANTDISIEVLSRLPAQTLQGLKLVSKEWKHLISDRSFIIQQLKRTQPQPLSGFFFQERYIWCDEDIKTISFIPFKTESKELKRSVLEFLPESVVLLATTNGLLCCRSCFPSPDPMIYVCNPMIKKWLAIKYPALDRHINLGIAFDTAKDLIDERTGFKVVVVHQTMSEENGKSFFSFDVYSEKTRVWSRLSETCQCRHSLYKNKGIFFGGALYWLTNGDQILMFDVQNELSWLIKVPLPFAPFESIPEMCIGESQGVLNYVLISEIGVQVWVLEDFLEFTWSVKHWVALDAMEKENPHLLCNLQERVASRYVVDDTPWMDPLAYNDGILLMRVASRVYFYHFETNKLEEFCYASALGANSQCSPIVLPYCMSLVPLDRPEIAG